MSEVVSCDAVFVQLKELLGEDSERNGVLNQLSLECEGKTQINNFVVGKKNLLAGLAVVCYVKEGGKWVVERFLISACCTTKVM